MTQGLQTEHLPRTVERLPGFGKVRLICWCGWVTPWRWVEATAEADHAMHRYDAKALQR